MAGCRERTRECGRTKGWRVWGGTPQLLTLSWQSGSRYGTASGLAIKLSESLPPVRPLPPEHSMSSPNSPSSWGANDETPKPVADTSLKPRRLGKHGQVVGRAEECAPYRHPSWRLLPTHQTTLSVRIQERDSFEQSSSITKSSGQLEILEDLSPCPTLVSSGQPLPHTEAS